MNNSSFINNNNNPNNPNNQQNNMYNNYNKQRMSNQNTRYFNAGNNFSNNSFNYTNANNKNNINDNEYFMENNQNNLNHSNSNFNYYNQSGQGQSFHDENLYNKNNEFYNFNKSESSFDRNRPKIKRKKILVLGAPGVGKSAVIMRFTDDVFKQDYIPTLQETYKKEFAFNNEKVELELNDLDGQNEFTLFSGNKFSFGINGYILCYSVENQYSFQMIESINSKLTSLVGDCVPKILIGNKSDLSNKRVISIEEGKSLAKKINASFLESSARSGLNIQLIFHSVLVEINKMESNIDLKNFSCSWFITFVIRNLYGNQLINYILLILQIVSCFFYFT
jgi:Ras family protein